MLITVTVIVGLLLLQYAINCHLLYSRVSHPLHVLWTECGPEARKHFPEFHFSDLERLGFRLAGYLVKSDGKRLRYCAIFIHSQNKDSAEVCPSDFLRLPVFKTRFEDGFAFEVGGSGNTPHQISGGADFPAFNFPQVDSGAELSHLHLLLKRDFSISRLPVIADGTGELREFTRKAEEVHSYHK
jgi:hypothetical protein